MKSQRLNWSQVKVYMKQKKISPKSENVLLQCLALNETKVVDIFVKKKKSMKQNPPLIHKIRLVHIILICRKFGHRMNKKGAFPVCAQRRRFRRSRSRGAQVQNSTSSRQSQNILNSERAQRQTGPFGAEADCRGGSRCTKRLPQEEKEHLRLVEKWLFSHFSDKLHFIYEVPSRWICKTWRIAENWGLLDLHIFDNAAWKLNFSLFLPNLLQF